MKNEKMLRLKLDSIESTARLCTRGVESKKEKFKVNILLNDLNSVWSEIYIPLMRSCEIFQIYSRKLDSLTRKSHSYFYSCQNLLIFTIIDCLLILHPQKIIKYMIENGICEDFTLIASVLRWHSNLKETAVGNRSFEALVQHYKSLLSFQTIFFSQYHFIESALIELKKIINIKEKHEENLWSGDRFTHLMEKKYDTLLFWQAKRGRLLQSSTSIQMAKEYIREECLVVLP